MVIELLRGWNGWKEGHVFPDVPEGQANAMVRFGIAKIVVTANAPSTSGNSTGNGAGQRTADGGSVKVAPLASRFKRT